MTRALHEMGFASGEAAIATLRLPGLLQAIADSTDGTSSSLAKLFPNVRGIGGELALTGKGLAQFASDVESMEKAGANLATSKYFQATATDAEKVTKELNKLKTALTVDLGESVLKAAADLRAFVGGADSIVQVAKAAGPALIGFGGSVVILGGQMMAARLEATSLAKSLGLLALVPLAFGAGKSIGQWVGDKMNDRLNAPLREQEAAGAKAMAEFDKQQSEMRDAALKVDDARTTSALRVVQQLNQSYLADEANAKRSDDALVKNTEHSLTRILHAREQLVSELGKAAAESADIVKASQERVTTLKLNKSEREFTGTLPEDSSRKAISLAEHAGDLRRRPQTNLPTQRVRTRFHKPYRSSAGPNTPRTKQTASPSGLASAG